MFIYADKMSVNFIANFRGLAVDRTFSHSLANEEGALSLFHTELFLDPVVFSTSVYY